MERTIRRGDIYYADLNPVIGSEQGGTRPVLIISNDIGNKYSPTVIIAAITSMPISTIFHAPNERPRLLPPCPLFCPPAAVPVPDALLAFFASCSFLTSK